MIGTKHKTLASNSVCGLALLQLSKQFPSTGEAEVESWGQFAVKTYTDPWQPTEPGIYLCFS